MFERFKGLFSESEDKIKIKALERELATLRYELDNQDMSLPPAPSGINSKEQAIKAKAIEFSEQCNVARSLGLVNTATMSYNEKNELSADYHLSRAKASRLYSELSKLKTEYAIMGANANKN